MPVSQENHQRITVAAAVRPDRVDELLDFIGGQLLAGAQLCIWCAPSSLYCVVEVQHTTLDIRQVCRDFCSTQVPQPLNAPFTEAVQRDCTSGLGTDASKVCLLEWSFFLSKRSCRSSLASASGNFSPTTSLRNRLRVRVVFPSKGRLGNMAEVVELRPTASGLSDKVFNHALVHSLADKSERIDKLVDRPQIPFHFAYCMTSPFWQQPIARAKFSRYIVRMLKLVELLSIKTARVTQSAVEFIPLRDSATGTYKCGWC